MQTRQTQLPDLIVCEVKLCDVRAMRGHNRGGDLFQVLCTLNVGSSNKKRSSHSERRPPTRIEGDMRRMGASTAGRRRPYLANESAFALVLRFRFLGHFKPQRLRRGS